MKTKESVVKAHSITKRKYMLGRLHASIAAHFANDDLFIDNSINSTLDATGFE